MLLNWQGRHFMEINHSRITSYEIADYMIRTKSLLSAKELAAILEKEYPHLDVDKRDVYLRLKAIAVSKYSSVLIDDSTCIRLVQEMRDQQKDDDEGNRYPRIPARTGSSELRNRRSRSTQGGTQNESN